MATFPLSDVGLLFFLGGRELDSDRVELDVSLERPSVRFQVRFDALTRTPSVPVDLEELLQFLGGSAISVRYFPSRFNSLDGRRLNDRFILTLPFDPTRGLNLGIQGWVQPLLSYLRLRRELGEVEVTGGLVPLTVVLGSQRDLNLALPHPVGLAYLPPVVLEGLCEAQAGQRFDCVQYGFYLDQAGRLKVTFHPSPEVEVVWWVAQDELRDYLRENQDVPRTLPAKFKNFSDLTEV